MSYTRTIKGNQGPTGFQGAQGYQGLSNAVGAQGIQGAQILVGLVGSDGVQGLSHEGLQGYQGAQGLTGSSSSLTGAQGAQGAQGTADNGVSGYLGPQGLADATPVAGTQGAQGNDGPQGLDGYTNSGGRVGAQGPQGNQGPDGGTGPSPFGFTGYTGLVGDGIQGYTGPQGINQGAQGVQGKQGAQGAQGQGNQGYVGTIGRQGPMIDPELYFEFYDDFMTTDLNHNWLTTQQSGSGGFVEVIPELQDGYITVMNDYGSGVMVVTPSPTNVGTSSEGILAWEQNPYLEFRAVVAAASEYAKHLIGFVTPPTSTSGGIYGSSSGAYAVFVVDHTSSNHNWTCKVKSSTGTETVVDSGYSSTSARKLAIEVTNYGVYFYVDNVQVAAVSRPVSTLTIGYKIQPRIAVTEVGTQLYAQVKLDYFYLRANRQ